MPAAPQAVARLILKLVLLASAKGGRQDRQQESQQQYNRGVELLQQSEYDGARLAFEKAVQLVPNNADALFNLANVHREVNNFKDAIIVYKKCAKARPTHADCYFNLGITYRRTNELELSIQAFKEVLRINPRMAKAYNVMGFQLSELGLKAEAISAYSNASALEPGYYAPIVNMAGLLADTGDQESYDMVLEACRAFERTAPKEDLTVMYTYANALQMRGFGGDALAIYRKLLEIVPKTERGSYLCGLGYTTVQRCMGLEDEIGHKMQLWRHVDTVQQLMATSGRRTVQIMPESFRMPHDLERLRSVFKQGSALWIQKPVDRSDGRGISVVRDLRSVSVDDGMLVQRYLHDPLLIDGRKFDMRMYVFVASYSPFRVYFHQDGVARYATNQYSNDPLLLKQLDIHITNDDVNHAKGITCGPERLVLGVRKRLDNLGYDSDLIWHNIEELVVLTMLGVRNQLTTERRLVPCYKLYGLDIMLDRSGKPWLLEINRTPSYGVSCNNEYAMKAKILNSILSMIAANLQYRSGDSTSAAMVQKEVDEFAAEWNSLFGSPPTNNDLANFAVNQLELKHADGFKQCYPAASSRQFSFLFDDGRLPRFDSVFQAWAERRAEQR